MATSTREEIREVFCYHYYYYSLDEMVDFYFDHFSDERVDFYYFDLEILDFYCSSETFFCDETTTR